MSPLAAVSVLQKFRGLYKPPRTFLAHRTPFDLLIATLLSAQCTDARVNIVTKEILYPKYKTARDYVRVTQAALERDVRTCGYFRTKAKNIQALCSMLIEKHGGKVPRTMEELVELPGIGRKTAAIILWACFNKNEGIAVDTHVMRLSRRLGLTKHAAQHKIEMDLMQALPRKDWGYFNTHAIAHGRAVCTARNRKCSACIFKKECPSSLVLGHSDLASSDAKRRGGAPQGVKGSPRSPRA